MSSYFPTLTLLQRVVTMSHERLRSAVAMVEGIGFHLSSLSLHNYFRHPFLQSLWSNKQVHNMYFESNVKTKIEKKMQKSSLRKFYDRYGDLIKHYEAPPLPNLTWHSGTSSYTVTPSIDQTFHLIVTLLPKWTLSPFLALLPYSGRFP